jgi:hypothetical protein
MRHTAACKVLYDCTAVWLFCSTAVLYCSAVLQCLTCEHDGLPKPLQHKAERRGCVGQGVRAVHNQEGVIGLPASKQGSRDK